jgi:hypothetical protein
MATLTGNPNVDVRILFSLPDKELLRLCATSQGWRNICEASENDVYWQARYEQRFPYLPAPPGANYRELYLHTIAQRQIRYAPEPADHYCTLPYLQHLSLAAYAWADALSEEAIDAQLSRWPVTGRPFEGPKPLSLGTDVRSRIVHDILSTINQLANHLSLARIGSTIISPWDINQVILREPLLREIFPDVRANVAITVCIKPHCSIHRLTKSQFMGMMFYLNHNPHPLVTFSLFGCPLWYSIHPLHVQYNVHKPGYILIMHDRSQYSLPQDEVAEIMQGFITMARWLGRNYRAGYATLLPPG